MIRLMMLLVLGAFVVSNARADSPEDAVKLKGKPKQADQKPWSPRADCSGLYGTASNASAQSVSLAELMKEPKKYQGKLVSVKANVRDVCQRKGCWMVLQDGTNLMRVRFKGYKFFIPKNCKGYISKVVGTAREATIPVKLARHYAEESLDKDAVKKITGPQKVIAFTAHYVVLSKGVQPNAPAVPAKPATPAPTPTPQAPADPAKK